MVELPERFGRYTILARLGRGGMGSVYLAEDTVLGRKVALKVANLGDDSSGADRAERIARFHREARAAAGLDHPNLCHIYDFGEVDGVSYLTMAYIEGKSLAETIAENGPHSPRQASAIVGKLALALQEAHARGIVHRDLKPSNVMMKEAGKRREPVLVDFGLARDHGTEDVRLTRSGTALGTVAYMAPEQVRADATIGPCSDIYGLGVILYELLAGRPPFEGPSFVVAAQVLTQEPPALSSLRPDLDPRLEAICLKAMSKSVAARYPTMADLAAAIAEYLRAETPPPPVPIPDGAATSPARIAAVPRLGDGVKERKAGRGMKLGPNEIISPTTGLVLVRIEAGEFDMGSPDNDVQGFDDERPQHRVRITKNFYMGKHAATLGHFRKFVEDTGYDARNDWLSLDYRFSDEHPVVNVSWNDAVAFCKWLSRKEGGDVSPADGGRVGVRLPRRLHDPLFLRRRSCSTRRLRLVPG